MMAQSCAKVLGRTDASIFVDRAEEERCTSDRVDRPRFARLRGWGMQVQGQADVFRAR